MSEGLVSVFGSERSGRSEAYLVFFVFLWKKTDHHLALNTVHLLGHFLSHTQTHTTVFLAEDSVQ